MEPEEYVEKVRLNAGNNGYDRVEAESDLFEAVFTKRKTVSYLDNGVERRFVSIGTFDELDIGTINDAIDELQQTADDNVSVDSAGGLATKPLIPIFATTDADGGVTDAVEDMGATSDNGMRVPVIAEIGGGGLMGSDISLTYPVPPRRKLPRRRAVKKVVSSLADV